MIVYVMKQSYVYFQGQFTAPPGLTPTMIPVTKIHNTTHHGGHGHHGHHGNTTKEPAEHEGYSFLYSGSTVSSS